MRNDIVCVAALAVGILGPMLLGWFLTIVIAGVATGALVLTERKKSKELTQY